MTKFNRQRPNPLRVVKVDPALIQRRIAKHPDTARTLPYQPVILKHRILL